jgi:hypothetical protein
MASLADFEDKAEEAPPTRPGGKSDLDQLPDGKYKFAVTGMVQKETKDGRLLVEIGLECLTPGPADGKKFDHVYWLNKREGDRDEMAFDRLRRDLTTLGFDVANWKTTNQRPFATEFLKACAVIKGVEFEGKKVTNKEDYANLYINKRVSTDGKPETFGPDELKAPVVPFEV